jgi:transposase-like protein
MARQPDPRKQQHWLDLVRRCDQSHLTVRAFCARHGLSQASFYLWRRVLRQRGLLNDQHAPTPRAPQPASRAAFVQLTVDAEASASRAIELVLSNRRLLRIPAGFDPATLRQLLRLLEEPAC